LKIEFLDLLNQLRIIGRVEDLLVLQKIEKASARNQIGNLGIISQGRNLRVLAQLARTREAEKSLGMFRLGQQPADLAQRIVSSLRDHIGALNKSAEWFKLE
jgi:hypothetical protein